MLVGELRELLSELDDDEPIALFLITHDQLHDEADAMGLDIDCEIIDAALEEVEELISRRIMMSSALEALALQRATSRITRSRERIKPDSQEDSESRASTLH
jgi:hypothetical protein